MSIKIRGLKQRQLCLGAKTDQGEFLDVHLMRLLID